MIQLLYWAFYACHNIKKVSFFTVPFALTTTKYLLYYHNKLDCI